MNNNNDHLPNYYKLFDLSDYAPYEEIKKRYNALALIHHPDRSQEAVSEFFRQIQQAWEALRDPQRKKSYDAQLKDLNYRSTLAINAEVDLDDMTYDEDEKTYCWSCRCGNYYKITEQQLEADVDVVQCTGCSLAIRVLYETEIEGENTENDA